MSSRLLILLEKLIAFVALHSPAADATFFPTGIAPEDGITEIIGVVFDVGEKAARPNVLGGSVQWGTIVLREEVEVVQEVPDLVIRGRGVACDKLGGIRGLARATNKAGIAGLRGARTYARRAERAGTAAVAARTRMATWNAYIIR